MMNWLLRGILQFGSPLLVLTVVACSGSGSRQLVLMPPTPPTTDLPALPDQVSQANLDVLLDSLADSFLLGETIEIPAQSFSFPAGLFSLTITITDPDGEEVVIVLTPELLGCNPAGTVCMIPATSLVLPELKPGTYSLSFEAIDQNGIPYGADREIAALEQEMEATPSPAPFNPNPGPLPDPAGTPTPSPSPQASPTPEPTPTADPGTDPVAGFDSQPVRRSTINVGSALIEESVSTSLTIIEIGNAPLQVEASITGREARDFQIEPQTFVIPDGGANQVATITCTPSAVGSRAATLTLTTNDPARPTISYPLECEGLAAPVAGFGSEPVSGSTIDLGSAILNTATGSQTLKISNTGTAKLEVGQGSITGANAGDFKIAPDTAFSIADGGADVDVTITCTPSALGSRTATLEFSTNDPDNATVSFDLTCEGAASLVVNTLDDEDGTEADTVLKCSLREAIIANNDGDAFGGCADPKGMITFDESVLSGGTITITGSALPAIETDVVIQGFNKDQLTISGNNTHRVFDIAATNDPVVTIEELTIANGSTFDGGGGISSNSTATLTVDNVTISGNYSDGTGAGIYAESPVNVNNSTLSNNTAGSQGGGIFTTTTATVSNSTLTGNSAGYGGGIFAITTATVSDSTFSDNSAGYGGGGIYSRTTATVRDSTLTGNSTRLGGGIYANTATVSDSTLSDNTAEYGGGIFAYTTATVSNSTLSGNSAGYNGGGINSRTTATVSDSTLSGNIAGDKGGGIFAYTTATVSNSTLSNNDAKYGGGGGIYARETADVSNSTLSGNSAGSDGGGIRAYTATVSTSTLSNNEARYSGGGINAGNEATVSNSIISGNIAPTGRECYSFGMITASFNLFGAEGDAGGCPDDGSNIVPGMGVMVSDILNPLDDNGGFSSGAPGSLVTIQTQSLPAGSPAIDAGDPSFTTPPEFDQRGSGFPRIVNGTVDIGAFEVQ